MYLFERHLFWQISQSSEETRPCQFGEQEDEYIKDQLIDKCYSTNLRRKCLKKEGSTTLNDLLVIARAHEAVNLQMEAKGTSEHCY